MQEATHTEVTLRASKLGQAARDTGAVLRHNREVGAAVRVFLDELARSPQDLALPRFADAKVHLLHSPGKLVRPLIVWLLARAHGIPDERIRPYALCVELVHTASLLHDDVIDRSQTRRHRPTANARFDNTLPVLAGDAVLAETIELLCQQNDLAAIRGVAATLQDLVTGEAWQYELRGTAHGELQVCVEVAELKTGALLALCTWLPAHLANLNEEDCARYAAIGRYTGVAYQLIDDILDIRADASGKPALGDWAEGKTSAVTAALLAAKPSAQAELEEFFAPTTPRTHEDCAARLKALFSQAEVDDAIQKVRDLAEEYASLAEHHAGLVPDNELGQLFERLRRRLLERLT